ncbi:putative membrane protein [Neobacillus niacini]|uniref:DUF420 domain-containing protein n=1 Tax=Neobacillus niacini TaxID=86668 RepID=UPI00278BA67A|nr:putative membrane protein [Neobacillus niacini]
MKILPLISTFCIVISAVLVAFGWYFIVKGNKSLHKRMMVSAAAFALLFFIIYITRTLLIGNTSFGGPASLKPYYTTFLLFHILLAITGVLFGAITIHSALNTRWPIHKKIGPAAAIIWFFSATTGILVYLILYVFFEPGPTKNIMRAILGIVE